MGYVSCLEEERLTLADCWSEQFNVQQVNLLKNPPGQWRSFKCSWRQMAEAPAGTLHQRGKEGGCSRDILITLVQKQYMGNLLLYSMKGFHPAHKITYRTETKEGNIGNGHNGVPTSWCNRMIKPPKYERPMSADVKAFKQILCGAVQCKVQFVRA